MTFTPRVEGPPTGLEQEAAVTGGEQYRLLGLQLLLQPAGVTVQT
jgi:hypothetical protein